MPIYEYRCSECGYQFDDYRPVCDRRYAMCPKCEEQAPKIFSLPSGIIMDTMKDSKGTPIHYKEPYFDNGLGTQINSKQQKADIMREKGLVMDGSSDKKEI